MPPKRRNGVTFFHKLLPDKQATATVIRMRDSELAVSIVDGVPGALAEAYDKYADLLWSYCRTVLSDADHAAEAVLDTFVIAASRLEVLRAAGRLRAWLYAVARVECMRRLRSSRMSAAASEAPGLHQAAAVLSTGEQRQLRAVLRTAFGGLDDAERDVMTMVWHGLDVAEVAAVLGVTRADAYALFTRARDQLEESVGVLLVGWSGRVGCAVVDAMLTGHDRQLTPDLRVRLARHVGKCGACADQHRRQMRPALVLGLSMGALLAEASDARSAAGRVPVGLWEEVYRMTSDKGPEAAWRRAMGSRRVAFGDDGFPKALAAREGMLTAPRLAVAAVGAVAAAATATGFAAVSPHGPAASGGKASTPIAAVIPVGSSAGVRSAYAAPTRARTLTVRPGRPSASASPSAPGVRGTGSPGAGSPGASSTGTGSAASSGTGSAASSGTGSSGSTGPSASTGPSGTSSAGRGSGSPSAGATASSLSSPSSGSSSPSPSPSSSGSGLGSSGSASPGAAQGTLSVSTSMITLAAAGSGSFTLTANGGPVNWSVSVPSGLLGSVSLSQASGSLAAGQSVRVTVSVTGLATLDTVLTISPGNQTVTVVLGLGL